MMKRFRLSKMQLKMKGERAWLTSERFKRFKKFLIKRLKSLMNLMEKWNSIKRKRQMILRPLNF